MKYSLVLLVWWSLSAVIGFSQTDSLYKQLKIDSAYACFQYYDAATGQRFLQHFEQSDSDKVVVFHYGGSHIQAERPTTFARALLQTHYGDGGRGMIFSYGAADTYSSVNYNSTKTGNWMFAKSFQLPAKLPLGVCGMTVETKDPGASLGFEFKEALPERTHKLSVFTEIDSLSYGFELNIDGKIYSFPKEEILKTAVNHSVTLTHFGLIRNISLKTLGPGSYFRFYGIDIEIPANKGIVYHSLGVGAAAMNSVLALEKAEQQAALLHPDIVILDFGTNDILYHNEINPKLAGQVERAIAKFRAINPDVSVVLTSPQDLFYKGHYITAGPLFRNLMDSLARKNGCLFWNWYDCAGGLRTIKTWENLGYAKSDYIHLTQAGYEVKGNYIAKSFENTIAAAKLGKSELTVPFRIYEPEPVAETPPPTKKPISKGRRYTVKSGDTLSQIARKYNTSVSKIKASNHLKNDMIRVGQVLVIP